MTDDPAPRSTLRIVLAAATVVLTLVAVWLVGGFLTIASGEWGWLWAGLAFGVGFWLAVALFRPKRLLVALLVATVAAFALGFADWQTSPPTHERIIGAYDVESPEGFTELSRSTYGSTWCYKGCPAVEIVYETPGSETDLAAFTEAAEEAGWTVSETETSEGAVRMKRGRWRMLVRSSERGADRLNVTLDG